MPAHCEPNVPFNELPPLPPAKAVETRPVLKAVIQAREKLAELRTACRLIPNPDIITATIPLREARASTVIENIVTTNDELFRAQWQIDNEPSAATKEALNYKDALYAGVQSIKTKRPLSEKTAHEVCTTLLNKPAYVRNFPGTFIGNPASQEKIYTPPEGAEVITQHLRKWEEYIYSDHDVDPLVKMALLHYQFEAIHPFPDGNGRTGRILGILYLLQEGILELPVLYLSGYIVENKPAYYRLLKAVTTDGSWEDWLLFMIRGLNHAATDATNMVEQLRLLQETTAATIRDAQVISAAQEMATLTLTQPYLRISNVLEAGLAQRQTASKWLNHLVKLGLLEETKLGREKIFINRNALEILTRD